MIPLGVLASARVAAGGGIPALTDSFNRANSATLGTADTGQTWVQLSGGPGISGNYATRNPNSGYAIIDWGYADMLVEVDIVAGAINYSPAILARCDVTFANAYHMLRLTSNTMVLKRRIAGADSADLNTFAYSLGDRVGISVKESGGSTIIKGWKNGVEQFSRTDTTSGRPSTGTYAGIGASHSTIQLDNFSVNEAP